MSGVSTSKFKSFDQKFKLYAFKFHNIFDGLLGLDNSQILQAKLDYKNSFLVTPYLSIRHIKIHFLETKYELNCITIPSCVEQVIRIETTIRDDDVIRHLKINNCKIPEC